MTPSTDQLLGAHDWMFPVPIHYGPGRLREVPHHCRAAGMSRPLVVTDRTSATLPFVGQLLDRLRADGLDHSLYCDISPNPRDIEIISGGACFRDGGHDGVVAIGGGSGMDGGKAIATIANNALAPRAFDYERTLPLLSKEQAFPPLVTIPTTAGTGAETESTAMLTDTARGMKYCTWHPQLKPTCTVLDPELTLGLPATLTAWTGCDALVHGIEGYCVPGFHPLCDGAAREGLRLIHRWLGIAVNEPQNLYARGAMLVGSCLAGIAFVKGLGLVHAISHMVGAEYDTHHGLTNAIALPAVLRFNAPAITDEVPPLAQALGIKDPSFTAFYGAICALLDSLAIPATLAEIGPTPDSVSRLAKKTALDTAATTNPRIASIVEIEATITEALIHGR